MKLSSRLRVWQLKEISRPLLTGLEMVATPDEMDLYIIMSEIYYEVLKANNYVGLEEINERYWQKKKELEYE